MLFHRSRKAQKYGLKKTEGHPQCKLTVALQHLDERSAPGNEAMSGESFYTKWRGDMEQWEQYIVSEKVNKVIGEKKGLQDGRLSCNRKSKHSVKT